MRVTLKRLASVDVEQAWPLGRQSLGETVNELLVIASPRIPIVMVQVPPGETGVVHVELVRVNKSEPLFGVPQPEKTMGVVMDVLFFTVHVNT